MIKRATDVVGSLLGLALTAPLLLIAALAIKLTSPGPAIFSQTRVGRGEKPFTCYKLRTMHAGTPHRASHEIDRGALTPVGGFLRKAKLDELPQLWNVLRGDMSLVGPRPCLPTQTALIEARRAKGVFAVRPGITGLAQVRGVDMSDPDRLAALDAAYVKQHSYSRDVQILLWTLLGRGGGDRVRG